MPDISWGETAKNQNVRPQDRIETDLAGEKQSMIKPHLHLSPPIKKGRPRTADLLLDAALQTLGEG